MHFFSCRLQASDFISLLYFPIRNTKNYKIIFIEILDCLIYLKKHLIFLKIRSDEVLINLT